MVERINKPEARPSYKVTAAKDVKEDQHKQEEQEEKNEKFKQQDIADNWQKFSQKPISIKEVRVQRQRINQVLYKNVFLKSSGCILIATIKWKDGRTTDPALFIIQKKENFLRLKSFKQGQIVPENFWKTGEEIIIGIIQQGNITGSWGTREKPQNKIPKNNTNVSNNKNSSFLKTIGLIDKQTNNLDWTNIGLYILGSIILIAIIMFVLK